MFLCWEKVRGRRMRNIVDKACVSSMVCCNHKTCFLPLIFIAREIRIIYQGLYNTTHAPYFCRCVLWKKISGIIKIPDITKIRSEPALFWTSIFMYLNTDDCNFQRLFCISYAFLIIGILHWFPRSLKLKYLDNMKKPQQPNWGSNKNF